MKPLNSQFIYSHDLANVQGSFSGKTCENYESLISPLKRLVTVPLTDLELYSEFALFTIVTCQNI